MGSGHLWNWGCHYENQGLLQNQQYCCCGLQKYSETWSDWINIKVEDICDKDKINVIVLEQNTDSEKSIDETQVANIQVIAHDWYESSSSL